MLCVNVPESEMIAVSLVCRWNGSLRISLPSLLFQTSVLIVAHLGSRRVDGSARAGQHRQRGRIDGPIDVRDCGTGGKWRQPQYKRLNVLEPPAGIPRTPATRCVNPSFLQSNTMLNVSLISQTVSKTA